MILFLIRKLQTLHVSSLSVMVMLVVTLTTFGIACIPNNSSVSLENKFMAGHAKLYQMYDSSYQRLGHKVGLLTLVLTLLAAIGIRRLQKDFQPAPSNFTMRFAKNARLCVGVLLFVGSATTILGFLSSGTTILGFVPIPEMVTALYLLQSVSIVAVCVGLSAVSSKNLIRATIWGAIIIYAAYLMIPGFFTAPHIPKAQLGAVQLHYGLVLGFADRLAINPDHFARWLPQYGLFLSTILGAYQHHFGLLNFGQHIRVVQVSQIAFVLAAFFAFYLWNPRKPITLLFALMLFGTYVSTVHPGVLYPNQSSWRFIGFPLWIILLVRIRNSPPRSLSLILGCASGLLLLCNLETGIMLAFGNFLFLISGEQFLRWRRMISHAAFFFAGAILAIGAFDVFFRMEFGRWPFSFSSLAAHKLLSSYNTGYGGLPLKMDFLAIFIFMHCVYLVSLIALRWHGRQISPRVRIKFAVAFVILIWFAYYMNRPNAWNLWTFLFFYSFIAVDYLNMRRLSLLWRRRGLFAFIDMRAAAIIWLLLPYALYLNQMFIRQEIVYFQEATEADLASISGVNLPKVLVAALEKKAAFLESVRSKGKTIYLTRDSFIIPLMTKQLNPFSVQDVYLENFRADDFEHVVNDIKTSNAKYLLIDEPSSILAATDSAATLRFEFFKKVMKRLAAHYREVEAQSDWRIWERTTPDLQPAHLSPT